MEKQENKGIFERTYLWFKNLTVKSLLGAILIAFVIIIVLMSASYLPKVISRISSSFSAALYSVFVPAEDATMSADKKIINSGEDFTVTFREGDTKVDGLFTVSYDCTQNISLLALEAGGLKTIDCDTPYYLLDNSKSLKIRALTEDQAVVRLVLNGSLENNETQKSEVIGVARVTVTNKTTGTTVKEETTPTKPVNSVGSLVPNSSTGNYTPRPDLAVRVLQVGVLNTNNNVITNQIQFDYDDTVGIRFEVRNDGDAVASTWNFSASLPSVATPTYYAPMQRPLQPGESIQFTLGFSSLTNQYSSSIIINVDQSNLVRESNENNNTLNNPIINTGYNNNYYNDNYYNNNYNYNSNQGCYDSNGWFTYNCDGNDYYNNNYRNDDVDLGVEIIAVGKINSSGKFVEDDNINEGDDAAVKFRVTNHGDEDSERWDYEVDLKPAFSGDTYEKDNMASLDAGESITITVKFNDIDDDGLQRFTVEIDPNDDIDDDYRNNNTDSMSIDVD